MMRRFAIVVLGLVVALGVGFWMLTGPERLESDVLADLPDGDAERGEDIFWAGGCASCHADPDAEDAARFELGGGAELETAFGTFIAPNISPHPEDGIGAWSREEFADAMMRGVSPDGRHYYPAFPYTSYARMEPADASDLFAFLETVPEVEGDAGAHDIAFPYNIRRGIGLWKHLYMRERPIVELGDDAPEEVVRGRYLVEGPGHCGECHTPRLFTGGPELDRWLAGGEAIEGDGSVPDIRPGEDGLADWSQSDIAYYLESGFTPDFDSVGGAMVAVQENMAELPAEDREAIAAYLKALPGDAGD